MVVEDKNFFGNYLEHLGPFMQGEPEFAFPHGPCIINVETAKCNFGYKSGCGISADMTLSMSLVVLILFEPSNHNKMCACGSPLF